MSSVNNGITPLVSIITVVRNAVEELEETILSVFAQPYKNIEYLVIDGGSTDGTVDVIRKYADQIKWWESAPDSGIYYAMNKGWSAARDGSFILYLGAGDRIMSLPDNLADCTTGDVVYGTVYMGKRTVFNARADFHLRLYNSLHHQALLVNKALHPVAPFDTSFKVYADFDFNQRLLKGGANFVYSPLFKSYALPGGRSNKADFPESLRVIRKNFGVHWSLLALAGFATMRIFPFLKKLRPIQPGDP
jgi:glycosyltransferase involved in cell wall biosynthesis